MINGCLLDLLNTGRPEAAAVFTVKMICFFENDIRLAALYTELTDPVVYMNLSIPHGNDRHSPQVAVAAIGVIHYTVVVGLNNSKILVSAAAGYDVCLISIGKLHSHAETDQATIPLFELDILRRAAVSRSYH